MSVKFQETTQTKVTEAATETAKKAGEKHEHLSHRIGEYLTGGDAGKGYLAVSDLVPLLCRSCGQFNMINRLTGYRPT